MLRIRTYSDFRQVLKQPQNSVKSEFMLPPLILKGLRSFWQFSCFYGDYVSQPLEQRQKLYTSSQNIKS